MDLTSKIHQDKGMNVENLKKDEKQGEKVKINTEDVEKKSS